MPIDKSISNLVINKIPTQEIYNRLKEQDLINEDELYLVEEDTGSGEIITYDVATPTSNGLMSATDKAKLDEIEAQANKYIHPTYTAKSSGLYKVTVDNTGHVSATTAVAKADITSLGIPAQDTTYTAATTSADGLMSKTDKAKLNKIEAQANKYVHPSYTSKSKGFYKVTVDAQGHISSTTTVTKTDITNLGIPAQDTTYGVATESADGLMSKTDKAKLNNMTSSKVFSATIGTSWTENADTGVKSQKVTLSGVLATDTAKVDVAYTGNGSSESYAEFVEQQNQFLDYITNGYAETVSGGVTFYIFGEPNTVNIPIIVEVG